MALSTLTPAQKALRSTVALKALMAVSGLIMIGYLIAHMYGNLKVFAGPAAFDEYAHHLRTMGEPILPYGGALWIIRVILLASIIAHIYSAGSLWARDRRARGGESPTKRYETAKAKRGVQRTYSSFTLRWGGVIIVLFVIYHLMQLTAGWIHPGGTSPSPYQRVVDAFSVWWVVISYTIALLAIGFHLRHGVWSALTTLGANTSAPARRRLNLLAFAVAFVVVIGFLIPPFAIWFGLVN